MSNPGTEVQRREIVPLTCKADLRFTDTIRRIFVEAWADMLHDSEKFVVMPDDPAAFLAGATARLGSNMKDLLTTIFCLIRPRLSTPRSPIRALFSMDY